MNLRYSTSENEILGIKNIIYTTITHMEKEKRKKIELKRKVK